MDNPKNYELHAVVNKDFGRFIQEEDLANQIPNLHVSDLAVGGEGDLRPQWPSTGRAPLLPEAQFLSLPRAGHEPWIERPELIRAVIHNFLKDFEQC